MSQPPTNHLDPVIWDILYNDILNFDFAGYNSVPHQDHELNYSSGIPHVTDSAFFQMLGLTQSSEDPSQNLDSSHSAHFNSDQSPQPVEPASSPICSTNTYNSPVSSDICSPISELSSRDAAEAAITDVPIVNIPEAPTDDPGMSSSSSSKTTRLNKTVAPVLPPSVSPLEKWIRRNVVPQWDCNVPLSINSIPDHGSASRPNYTILVLITLIAYEAEGHALPTRMINAQLQDRFSYFRANPKGGWKSTARHELSTNARFIRKKHPVTRENVWELKPVAGKRI